MKYLIIIFLLSGCADKLVAINDNINRNPYVPGKYDCKNFVDDKYKSLIESGFKDEDIQFVITSYKGQSHVVLNVSGWILDNNYRDVYLETKGLERGLSYKYWNYYRTHPQESL